MAIQIQRYAYFGPLSGVSLCVGDQTLDVVLHPRKAVDLPPNHAFTKTLLAQKRLIPVLDGAGTGAPPPPPPPPGEGAGVKPSAGKGAKS